MVQVLTRPYTDALAALGFANPEAQSTPVGDNVDCTAAFQDALTQGSGRIVVPPASYQVGSLKLPSGAVLQGTHNRRYYAYDGGPMQGTSRLVPIPGLTSGSLLDVNGSAGVKLDSICLDGLTTLGGKINGVSGGSSDLAIVDSSIGRFANGLGDTSSPATTIARFSRSEFTACGGNGLVNLVDSNVTDCELTANGGSGALLVGVASVCFGNTRVEWNKAYGYNLYNVDSIQISSGIVDAQQGQGLRADGKNSRLQVAKVHFRRNGRKDTMDYVYAHMTLAGCDKTLLLGNQFSHGGADGNNAPPDTPTGASLILGSNMTRLLLAFNDFANGTAGTAGKAVTVKSQPSASRAIGNLGYADVAEGGTWATA